MAKKTIAEKILSNHSGQDAKAGDIVVCDLDLLETLPEKEIRNGFAEIVKHALIGDQDLFSYFEANCDAP